MTQDVRPFEARVDKEVVGDLNKRLGNTRWPDELPGSGWELGTDLAYLKELCGYWRDNFDWQGFEARVNAFPQFATDISGQRVHFLHARSPRPDAVPLLLIHGWPGCVLEFREVVGPLSDPDGYGEHTAGAFHVIAPSIPGYGFSGPTSAAGWDLNRIADVFAILMDRLGYDRYLVQGGDWGSAIALAMAARVPDRVRAVHVNLLTAAPPGDGDPMAGVTAAEQRRLGTMQRFLAAETGYQALQSTKPQSLAYGLADSPAGLAGWLVEKYRGWSDCGGDVERSFTRDRLLDNISLYWVTGTINSSMRLYHEALGPGKTLPSAPVRVPLGHAVYPAEIYACPRRWADACYDVVHWVEMPRGGHFAAMEVPDLFVDDMRSFARTIAGR